ncbi:MAG: Flp pilus assembly complex ATPase component TadA [Proteobacteria bacterium]|nr:Flp pilus assembly complex ATPase component TadA [Pseudomonadota bacterium]MBU1648382.1 Flp pilus assembly complex ATPase component TadA [Pseudomonadota bacterium]MBU1987057.1 Flp pilus assembly complex ATPase component TadA [Pseudomonadota bacterium]
MTMPGKKKPLGAVLVDQGFISEDQLRIALLEQKQTNKPLGKVLIELGFVTDAIIRDALSENIGQGSVDLTNTVIDAETLRMVPQELARRHNILPLSLEKSKNQLVLAMADTFNVVAIDQIRALHGGTLQITAVLGGEADILRAIEQFYGFELSIDGILQEIETGEIDYQSLQLGNDEYSHPMVRLIDALLADAVSRGASDIHFEPEAGFLRIRYRIDGVLRQVRSLHKSYWSAMVVRLKVVSNMNIAESRAPQDGRISLSLVGRQIDFRVAAQPTLHGENIVLRILDRQKGLVPLHKLGLTDENLDQLKLMLARPEGIILVTGPTGSGKTTTLYSVLSHVNTEAVNIMTMEDPVEYPMAMIRQSSINESAKMGFADGIRSMMRQDPDVILVGEIRDHETAEMAFRAAMTGHQVFSTLHTNSAVGSIPRLLDIGVLPDIMAGNIIGIVAQRLIRRLCPECKYAYYAGELELKLLGVDAAEGKEVVLYQPVGCKACEQQGYKGRTTVMELLRINAELEDLIARRVSTRELLNKALAGGFRPLADDACRRVLDGTTSLDEISRVVDLTYRLSV